MHRAGPALTGDEGHRFSPVYLGVGTIIELQRKVYLRLLVLLAPLGNVPAQGGVAAGVAFLLQDFGNLAACVPSLARQSLVLLQELVDACLLRDCFRRLV